MKKKKILLHVLLLVVVGFFLFVYIKNVAVRDAELRVANPSVYINNTEIKVDVAHSAEEKSQGLSGRKELADNHGMLFVFDHPGQYAFWMKEMNFPIDIIWISASRNIVSIKKNAKPNSYPEVFTPSENSLYVLEVPGGFSDKHNFKVGDLVLIKLN